MKRLITVACLLAGLTVVCLSQNFLLRQNDRAAILTVYSDSTTAVPLAIDAPAHPVTNLMEWKTNGVISSAVSSNGHFRALTGTAALPSYAFNADQDTGMRFRNPGLGWIVDGSERLILLNTELTVVSAAIAVNNGANSRLTFASQANIWSPIDGSIVFNSLADITTPNSGDFKAGLFFGGRQATNGLVQFVTGTLPQINFRDGVTNKWLAIGLGSTASYR